MAILNFDVRKTLIYLIRSNNVSTNKIIFQAIDLYFKKYFSPDTSNYYSVEDRLGSDIAAGTYNHTTAYATRFGNVRTYTQQKSDIFAKYSAAKLTNLRGSSVYKLLGEQAFECYSSKDMLDMKLDRLTEKMSRDFESLITAEFDLEKISELKRIENETSNLCIEICEIIEKVIKQNALVKSNNISKLYQALSPRNYKELVFKRISDSRCSELEGIREYVSNIISYFHQGMQDSKDNSREVHCYLIQEANINGKIIREVFDALQQLE